MNEEIVKIPKVVYGATVGSFGVQRKPSGNIEWITCRDTFQGTTETPDINSFLFIHEGPPENIIEFIKTFEQACNCPHDKLLTIKKTTEKNVLWIGLSDWWKYRVRRSLLTALLRQGQNFTERNGPGFVKALQSHHYLASTKLAVEYFMTGHTAVKMKKTDSFPGWYAFFSQRPTKGHLEKCLVKLKKQRKKEDADKEKQNS